MELTRALLHKVEPFDFFFLPNAEGAANFAAAQHEVTGRTVVCFTETCSHDRFLLHVVGVTQATCAAVLIHKQEHPERYCPAPRCLWNTGGGYCPRHAPKEVSRYGQVTYKAAADALFPEGCTEGNNSGGECDWCQIYYNGPAEKDEEIWDGEIQ